MTIAKTASSASGNMRLVFAYDPKSGRTAMRLIPSPIPIPEGDILIVCRMFGDNPDGEVVLKSVAEDRLTALAASGKLISDSCFACGNPACKKHFPRKHGNSELVGCVAQYEGHQ